MNKIPNRQAICEVLMDRAKEDKNIVVLCSDSRGSASMTPFADAFPEQFVETGIAEQNLVSISAGLAKCGKKTFACSPACDINWNKWWCQLWCIRNESSFSTGYSINGSNS